MMPTKTIELISTIRQFLGEDSRHYLSDDRLATMAQITGGLQYDTLKIALGYILKTLDLRVHNRPNDADGYRHDMTFYQDLLNKSAANLAA